MMEHFEKVTDRTRYEADIGAARLADLRYNREMIDSILAEMARMEIRGISDDLKLRFEEIRVTLAECRADLVVLLEEDDHEDPV